MEIPMPHCFIPNYIRKVMYGNVKADISEVLKKLCNLKKVQIIEGAVCADYVHLCVSTPS
jgi:putative transposase